jgi:hypothetical protein
MLPNLGVKRCCRIDVLDRRTHWPEGARGVRRRVVRCRGIFSVPVQRGRTAWHKGHDRRTRRAFEPTSQAPPRHFVKGRLEYDETVGATDRFQRNYDGNETMSRELD